MLMGWGWYLSDEAATQAIALEIRFSDGIEQTIPCLINRARDDVAQAFPANSNAATSGFIFLSRLDSRSSILSTSLMLTLDNGTNERHLLPGFPERFAPDSMATEVVLTRIQKVWRLAMSGRISHLLERLKAAIKRSSKSVLQGARSVALPANNVDLLFDHQLGGGANKFREEKIAQILRSGRDVVLVTFDLPRVQYRLELRQSSGKRDEVLENLNALQAKLSQARYSTIHVNNLVSFPDPLMMIQLVERLMRQSNSELTLYLHDYLPACPSYTLINADGKYCGIPSAETCRICLKTNKSVFPSFVVLKEIMPWRDAWDQLFRTATTIVAFSQSTIDIFQRAFTASDWREKIVLQPHVVDISRYPRILPQMNKPLKIAVIGNINFVKGAEIVHDMLALIEQRQLPVSVVVIGTLERHSASPALTVTGPFENSMLPKMLEQHGIGVCWLPSICPETFSYVTEEIITMGLPLVCFDLGAPASRVRRYEMGEVAKEVSAQSALEAINSLEHRIVVKAA